MPLMHNNPVLSANILLCESVTKDNGMQSANRILDIFSFSPSQPTVRFKALTLLTSNPGDRQIHTVHLEMRGYGVVPAFTHPQDFYFAYSIDASAPGGYQLTTNFELSMALLPCPGTFSIVALVDRIEVAHTPITLRAR
jgi:hypothetical protein